jgi:mercuric reductase
MRLAGLHCEGCAMLVKDSLEKVPGVVSAKVSQPKQTAILTIGKKTPSAKLLKAAVVKAGYKVVRIE